AMSARTLRSRTMFAFFRPAMKREYETPFSRAAALIRAIQSERKSRRRTRRPRADCIIARSTASTPRLKQFFRRPRNPRASLRTRLRRRRALKPLLTRIAQLSLLRKPIRERLLEMALVAALEHF